RAVVLTDGAFLEAQDFPQIVSRSSGREEALRTLEQTPLPVAPIHIDAALPRIRPEPALAPSPDRFLGDDGQLHPLADIERAAIEFAIRHHGGRMSRVARALGIGRSTLYRKLHEYGLAEGLIGDAA